MGRKVLFVEFFGLPGAGKTTIANIVTQKLNDSGYKIYTMDSLMNRKIRTPLHTRGFRLLRFFVMNPVLSVSMIRLSFFLKPMNAQSFKFIYAALRMVFKIEQAKKNATSGHFAAVVFDQGMLQDIWSACVTGIPENIAYLEAYLKNVLDRIHRKIRFKIIFLDVKPEISARRVQGRPSRKYRFEIMDDSIRIKSLRKKSIYFSVIVKAVTSLKNCKYLELDNNTEDSEERAEDVYYFIKHELSNGLMDLNTL